jgi:hypothetical protein
VAHRSSAGEHSSRRAHPSRSTSGTVLHPAAAASFAVSYTMILNYRARPRACPCLPAASLRPLSARRQRLCDLNRHAQYR